MVPGCRRWPSTGVRFGVGTDHCGGVEAADLAGGGHLAREPAPELRVVRVVRVHYLDRDLSVASGSELHRYREHADAQ